MKRNLLPLLAIAFLSLMFFSCRKNGDDPSYFIKVNVDGTWVTYEGAYCELGPDLGDPSLTDLVVNGGDDNVLISLAVQSTTGSINTGTYNTAAVSPPYYMLIDYWKILPNDIQVFDATGPGTGNDPYFTLTITSITDTEIRGNFTGNYLYNSTEDESINITGGEFVAQRVD